MKLPTLAVIVIALVLLAAAPAPAAASAAGEDQWIYVDSEGVTRNYWTHEEVTLVWDSGTLVKATKILDTLRTTDGACKDEVESGVGYGFFTAALVGRDPPSVLGGPVYYAASWTAVHERKVASDGSCVQTGTWGCNITWVGAGDATLGHSIYTGETTVTGTWHGVPFQGISGTVLPADGSCGSGGGYFAVFPAWALQGDACSTPC